MRGPGLPGHGAAAGRSPLRKTRKGEAILDITTACNQRCVFCSEGEHAEPYSTPLRTVKGLLLLLEKKGIGEINFMGGEAALRPDFPELVSWMKLRGFRTGLATNALKFSDLAFARRVLPCLAWLEISLHAPDAASFHAITGRRAYGRYLRGVRNIVRANAELGGPAVLFFTVVINSLNYKRLGELALQARRLAGRSTCLVHFKFIDPEGSAAVNSWIVPRAQAVRGPLVRALRLAQKQEIPAVVSRLPLCFFPGLEHMSLDAVLTFRKLGTLFLDKKPVRGARDLSREERPGRPDLGPACRGCRLALLCPGLDGKYLALRGPVRVGPAPAAGPAQLAAAIRSRSLFYRIMNRFQEFTI